MYRKLCNYYVDCIYRKIGFMLIIYRHSKTVSNINRNGVASYWLSASQTLLLFDYLSIKICAYSLFLLEIVVELYGIYTAGI